MGYIKHDVVIATAGPADKGLDERVAQWRAALPQEWQALVVGPIAAAVNCYETWIFAPDGSKEHWDTSDEGDEYRSQFCDLFSGTYADVVSMSFGGDERDEFEVPRVAYAVSLS